MSVDHRTRRHREVRDLSSDEVFDVLLPDAIADHGEMAARGITYKELPSIGFVVDGREVTLAVVGRSIQILPGVDRAGVVAEMATDALSDLVQDSQSTMGLAMTSRTRITAGTIDNWIAWEPALRALLDGRKVHETGDIDFVDLDGTPLDLYQTFTIHDDHEVVANFLEQSGFLHLRNVFEPAEMDSIGADIDEWIAKAQPGDGESWWAQDASGQSQAVRVLFFLEKSDALAALVNDDRYQWIGDLTGDGHERRDSAEGLIKPLGITRGLSDLPWHKDCGQGQHAYMCNSLTCGISVTGADRTSGALGVIAGSHRANTWASSRDPNLDLPSRTIETKTGDVTVHCSDTLHRAYPPIDRPRKVVYSGFSLPMLSGDVAEANPRYSRAARAELSDVEDRIEASAS